MNPAFLVLSENGKTRLLPSWLARAAGALLLPGKDPAASAIVDFVRDFPSRFLTPSFVQKHAPADVTISNHQPITQPTPGFAPAFATPAGITFTPLVAAKDELVSAEYAGGTKALVRFSDGFNGHIDLKDLGLETRQFKLESMRQSWGSAVEIDMKDGDTFYVDSSVVRAHLDPKYAKELEDAIAAATKHIVAKKAQNGRAH